MRIERGHLAAQGSQAVHRVAKRKRACAANGSGVGAIAAGAKHLGHAGARRKGRSPAVADASAQEWAGSIHTVKTALTTILSRQRERRWKRSPQSSPACERGGDRPIPAGDGGLRAFTEKNHSHESFGKRTSGQYGEFARMARQYAVCAAAGRADGIARAGRVFARDTRRLSAEKRRRSLQP